MGVLVGVDPVSVPFRGLRGLEGWTVAQNEGWELSFSPLPGFEGSGGPSRCTRWVPRQRFSPLPGFEGSGGLGDDYEEISYTMFQSPSGV